MSDQKVLERIEYCNNNNLCYISLEPLKEGEYYVTCLDLEHAVNVAVNMRYIMQYPSVKK